MAAARSWSPGPAALAHLDLPDVVRRLAGSAQVEGIVAFGSTGLTDQPAWADFDLFLLVHGWPSAVRVGVTYIDGRLTDLLFAEPAALDRILETPGQLDATTWDGRLARGLQSGRILFDRSGRLAGVQRHLETLAAPPTVAPVSEAYRYWFRINYNRLQTRRMLDSDDLTYLLAVDARLLYMVSEVFTAYFSVRDLIWDGEKAAIRYLRLYDRAFLDQFQACIAAMDRADRFRQYEELARLALAPVGPLWDDHVTVFTSDTTAEAATQQAQQVWQHLVQAG